MLISKNSSKVENKVDNAIIMAAGTSSRFAPLSFERPKGLLEVKGEILIERQIRQLKEVGINDITIVVGYMKKKFLYLQEKFGVKIVENLEYKNRNNNSTLYVIREELKNTYICSSDNYFTKNVFESHVPSAYYSAVYNDGETDEYCITTNEKDIITEVKKSGENSWIMMGHVYFNKEFSNKFIEILESEYDKPSVHKLLWEDIYIKEIDKLPMMIKKYDKGEILEFDCLEDLREFDETYKDNTRSQIIENICSVLGCMQSEVSNIVQLNKGLTNISLLFEVNREKFIYRHPGIGTDEIINRESEAFSQEIARELGLDNTFIYMNSQEGWKISKYVSNCKDFDYRNNEDVKSGLALVKKLHDACIQSKWEFNIFRQADNLLEVVSKSVSISKFDNIVELRTKISRLYELTEIDNVQKCLCHNDC